MCIGNLHAPIPPGQFLAWREENELEVEPGYLPNIKHLWLNTPSDRELFKLRWGI